MHADEVSLALPDEEFLAASVRLMQEAVLEAGGLDEAVDTEAREAAFGDARLIQRVCDEFSLVLDSPYGAGLIADYLAQRPSGTSHRLLALLVPLLPRFSEAALGQYIARGLHDERLSATQRRELLDPVLPLLDDEAVEGRVFTVLGDKLRQQLKRWRILTRMEEHYGAQPVKERFMLNYLSRIEDVATLDNRTLALRFRGFTIIDSLADLDASYYYPDGILSTLIERGADVAGLGQPAYPYRRLSNPEDMQAVNGVIQLGFVGQRLADSRRFMDLKLEMPQARHRAPFSRWLASERTEEERT